jgi:hypothetical protein
MKVNFEKFGEIEVLNYVDLTPHDKYFVLEMRNHPDIKKWMYNKNKILNSHIKCNFF